MHVDVDELDQSAVSNDNDDYNNDNNNNDDDDDGLIEVESFSEDNYESAQPQQIYSQQPNENFSVKVRGNTNSIKRGGNKVNKNNNNPNNSYNTYNINNTVLREPTQIANGPSK